MDEFRSILGPRRSGNESFFSLSKLRNKCDFLCCLNEMNLSCHKIFKPFSKFIPFIDPCTPDFKAIRGCDC